jgi:hypothetical protein
LHPQQTSLAKDRFGRGEEKMAKEAPEQRGHMSQENSLVINSAAAAPHSGPSQLVGYHPLGTGFGSTIGAALVSVAMGAAGAGSVAIYTSAATGVVIGGWAGHAISRRRSKRVDADVLRRRSRTIRLLRVTRMLRRRDVA